MSRGRFAGNFGRGSHWIRDRKRRRIYWRDGFRCLWCGRSDRLLSLDHILPRNRGGSNEAHNLVTACLACNEDRGDRSAVSYAFHIGNGNPDVAGWILNELLERMDRELP